MNMSCDVTNSLEANLYPVFSGHKCDVEAWSAHFSGKNLNEKLIYLHATHIVIL